MLFLQELRDIRAICFGPWLIVGDINLIYRASDNNNSNLYRVMMDRFRKLIEDLSIKEIPLMSVNLCGQNSKIVLSLLSLIGFSVQWSGKRYFTMSFKALPLKALITAPAAWH